MELKKKKSSKEIYFYFCVLISCLFNLGFKMMHWREEQIQMILKTIWTNYVITLKSKFHHFLSLPSVFIFILTSLAMRPKRKKSFTSIKRTLRISIKWLKTSMMHFIAARLVFDGNDSSEWNNWVLFLSLILKNRMIKLTGN